MMMPIRLTRKEMKMIMQLRRKRMVRMMTVMIMIMLIVGIRKVYFTYKCTADLKVRKIIFFFAGETYNGEFRGIFREGRELFDP
jgi:hypothetical protein